MKTSFYYTKTYMKCIVRSMSRSGRYSRWPSVVSNAIDQPRPPAPPDLRRAGQVRSSTVERKHNMHALISVSPHPQLNNEMTSFMHPLPPGTAGCSPAPLRAASSRAMPTPAPPQGSHALRASQAPQDRRGGRKALVREFRPCGNAVVPLSTSPPMFVPSLSWQMIREFNQ